MISTTWYKYRDGDTACFGFMCALGSSFLRVGGVRLFDKGGIPALWPFGESDSIEDLKHSRIVN